MLNNDKCPYCDDDLETIIDVNITRKYCSNGDCLGKKSLTDLVNENTINENEEGE